MNEISLSEFKRLGVNQIESIMPTRISVDGTSKYIIAREEDVISVGDLNINVRKQLRAREKRARIGMPKDTKLFADDVPKPIPVAPVEVTKEELVEAIYDRKDGTMKLLELIRPRAK